jgi:hypothetical protein
MRKLLILLSTLVLFNGCGSTQSDNTQPADENTTTPTLCAEVITHAYNPQTMEEQDFSTPCDVPDGWIIGTPDITKPTITLLGDTTVTQYVGKAYSDAGATAYDNEDGDISSKIVVVSNVSTTIAGTYSITYSITDNAGNKTTALRTVIIKPIEVTIDYKSDATINLRNPFRGFYDADYNLEIKRDYNPFENAYSHGYRLVYAPINLADYNALITLPDSLIDTIDQNLQQAQSSGIGLILRIKYRDMIDSNDPDKTTIISHLDQLKSTLQKYRETIAVVQVGLIGAWGEWHSFTGDFSQKTDGYIANRKALLEKLSDIFPDTFLQIRTPMHKELIFGTTQTYGVQGDAGMITSESAYGSLLQSQIGHHNDCFLINATDAGTYMENDIDFWKSYVANDTLYAPMGGETCGVGEGEDAHYSDCDNSINMMKYLHFSFLNDNYHPDVLQKWKDQGCYETIKSDLGYRLEASSLTYALDDATLDITLHLQNKGYAVPFRSAVVTFHLQNDTYDYQFQIDGDIRKWYANVPQTIQQHIDLSNIDAGEYCLSLEIESFSQYIALSNYAVWDDLSQQNTLACSLKIHKF